MVGVSVGGSVISSVNGTGLGVRSLSEVAVGVRVEVEATTGVALGFGAEDRLGVKEGAAAFELVGVD